MRRFLPVRARIHEHRWGALWGVFPDAPERSTGAGPVLRRRAPDGRLPAHRRRRGLGLLVGAAGPHRGGAGAGVAAFRADLLSLAPVAEPVCRPDVDGPAAAGVLPQVSLRRWHDGTLVLLGDAAHALSPQLGQGANLALMDAAALADAPSLDDFEAARRAQARFYGFGARALNVVFQNDHRRAGVAAGPPDGVPASRLPWVQQARARRSSRASPPARSRRSVRESDYS